MAEFVKDKRHPDTRAKDEKKHEGESSGYCEICGQKLECDPESGECRCPDCDYSDR